MKTYPIRKLVSPHLTALRIFGYWAPENKPKFVGELYAIYTFFFVNLTFFLQIASETANIFFSLGDLEKLSNGLFLFLTHLAQAVKFYILMTRRERIINLLDGIERSHYGARNAEQFEMILERIRIQKMIFYSFQGCALSTCTLWGIFPFLETNEGHVRLPLSGWYPFETDQSPVFELIFAYQIVCTSINAVTNVSIDTLAGALMDVLAVQLDLLNDNLRNLHGKIISKQLETDDKFSVDKEAEKLLIKEVNHHWFIVKDAKEVNDVFSACAFGQFSVGCIIICLTLFKLTLVPVGLEFISLILYQMCMLVEVVLYSWFGNEIILKSSNIGNSLYSSGWFQFSEKFKTNMKIIMICTQSPIKLYAGNFFALSVPTLLAILKSSWSYFAVLHRVHDD